MRLLLVEDNSRLASLIEQGVVQNGYTVDTVTKLRDAELALDSFEYGLLILDLGLPDGDGLDLLRKFRREGRKHPVLILTARDALNDRVKGLDCGADDYLTKPFSMIELIARINALLRRPFEWLGDSITRGNICLDVQNRIVTVNDIPLGLSSREYAAMECLLRSHGICGKQRLEDIVYGMNAEVSPNALEVLIHRLRKQLGAAEASVTVKSVRGMGYILEQKK
jgi:DNA-binding response OmpR family regulator